jgi:hypothetical protein
MWVGMRERGSTSIESSRAAAPDALIALVRLLARQAAGDFVLHTPTPPDTSLHPQDRK